MKIQRTHCTYGHDLRVHGKYGKNKRGCDVCHRRRSKEQWRRNHGLAIPSTGLETAPLRPLLRVLAAKSVWDNRSDGELQTRGGIKALKDNYAARFGLTERSAERHYRAVMSQKFITEWLGDQWACFLGRHPSEIWGENWADAS